MLLRWVTGISYILVSGSEVERNGTRALWLQRILVNLKQQPHKTKNPERTATGIVMVFFVTIEEFCTGCKVFINSKNSIGCDIITLFENLVRNGWFLLL